MQPITVSLCIFALLNKESNGQPVRNEIRRETSCSVRNRLLQQTAAMTESFLFLHGRSHHHKHLQIRMNQIKKENIRQDRTTHYDISPTLLHDVLGVSNPPSDYSMGKYLEDPSPRDWHLVGHDLYYAFIRTDGTIIEKQGSGNLKIMDRQMRPVPGYPMNPRQLQTVILNMNRFFK